MYIYHCQYCNKDLEFDKPRLAGPHKRNCKNNPNLQNIINSILTTKNAKKHQYILNCSKCNCQYTLHMTQYKYNKGNYRKYCSKTCSNSRTHSQQTKEKISKSLIKQIKWINCTCEKCGKEFIVDLRRKKRFCSTSCRQSYIACITWDQNHKQNMMKIFRKSFQSGIRPCRGGKTKRYKYKDILVQGTYQLRTCFILDQLIKNNKIKQWQYTNQRIKYLWNDNTQHFYFPDFKITNNDNSWYYLEIKGFKTSIDELKWNQANWQGFNLVVWFEKDIINMELQLNG